MLADFIMLLYLSASWAPSGKDSGGAPQLKGARWFSYEELKKCTNNFSDSNEIGSGGYGKVKIQEFYWHLMKFCFKLLMKDLIFFLYGYL